MTVQQEVHWFAVRFVGGVALWAAAVYALLF